MVVYRTTKGVAHYFVKSENIRGVHRKSLRKAYESILKNTSREGLHLEFGVYKGKALEILAGMAEDVSFYGFDSFEGLPEDFTDRLKTTAFTTSVPNLQSQNTEIIAGKFEDTLVPFLKEHLKPVSFVHIDCDVYSSTFYILKTLHKYKRLIDGTVIVFDEFFVEEDGDWYNAEFCAFMDFILKNAIDYEWLWYYKHNKFALRVKDG